MIKHDLILSLSKDAKKIGFFSIPPVPARSFRVTGMLVLDVTFYDSACGPGVSREAECEPLACSRERLLAGVNRSY